MKKSRFFSALLIVSLLFVLLPANAKAAMWDVPVGPGETFRWVFVTWSLTQACSSDIDNYNTFVNAAADIAATPITDVVGFSSIAEINWKAIGSTETTDAIDNIGVSTAGIYTPMGALVANGTADMFDGDIYNPINYTETGTEYNDPVWTGTSTDGTAGAYYLGDVTGWTIEGRSDVTTSWVERHPGQSHYPLPMFSISEDLTVVPAPGAVILGVTGMLSASLGLKRLRRKDQEPRKI